MNHFFKKRQTIVGVAMILIVSGVLAIRWSQQPAFGTLASHQVDGTDVKSSSNTQEAFETSLFSTRISSSFKMKSKNEIPSPSILGQYLLAHKDVYVSDQLAVTVGVAQDENVGEVSPVQFRRALNSEYEEVATGDGFPEGSVSFVKKTNFEKSVIWIVNGRYAAVVVSGGIQNRANLEEALRTVVVNWKWK